MFDVSDNFWNAFLDEFEKIGALGGAARMVLPKVLKKGSRIGRPLRQAPAGRARKVPGFGAGRRSVPKPVSKPLPTQPQTAKPSVPASAGPIGPGAVTPPPKVPAAPKEKGKSPTKKRSLWGDIKGVGRKAGDTAVQSAPFLLMGRGGGGQPPAQERKGVYV